LSGKIEVALFSLYHIFIFMLPAGSKKWAHSITQKKVHWILFCGCTRRLCALMISRVCANFTAAGFYRGAEIKFSGRHDRIPQIMARYQLSSYNCLTATTGSNASNYFIGSDSQAHLLHGCCSALRLRSILVPCFQPILIGTLCVLKKKCRGCSSAERLAF